MSKFNPETENWKPERRKQMLKKIEKIDKLGLWNKDVCVLASKLNELITHFNNLPNEIIEMLWCPTCEGKKYTETKEPLFDKPEPNMIVLSVDRVRGWDEQIKHGMYSIKKIPCPTCNGTGIRLPEKVVEVVKKPDDLIEDVYVRPTPNARYKATLKIHKEMPSEKVEEKQLKEQSEDLTEIKLSKEDFQQIQESIENPQYNEKLAEALKRPLGFEQEQSEDLIQLKFKINQLENSLSKKDKEIAEIKAERDKYKKKILFDAQTYCDNQCNSINPDCKNCSSLPTNVLAEALGEG